MHAEVQTFHPITPSTAIIKNILNLYTKHQTTSVLIITFYINSYHMVRVISTRCIVAVAVGTLMGGVGVSLIGALLHKELLTVIAGVSGISSFICFGCAYNKCCKSYTKVRPSLTPTATETVTSPVIVSIKNSRVLSVQQSFDLGDNNTLPTNSLHPHCASINSASYGDDERANTPSSSYAERSI